MDLKQLQRFVAVAQTLNYRRAARQLGITQPPLTRAIRELERSLGVTLLARSRKEVSLTPAGCMMLAEAPRLIAQAKLLEATVLRTATELQQLRVGFVGPALYRIIPTMMRGFRARWPSLDVTLEELSSAAQLERLNDGRLDLGVVMLETTGLEPQRHRVIERSRLVLAVPADSPLAAQSRVQLRDAARLGFILQTPEANPATYDATIAACSTAGFAPRVVQRANQGFTILKLVASGIGVAFVPEMVADLDIEGVKCLPITDKWFDVAATLCIVWARDDLPREMREFVRMAELAGRASRRTAGAARRRR